MKNNKNTGNLSPVERIEAIERSLGLNKRHAQVQLSSKWKSVICMVLAMALLCGGALAYFTDYATTQVKGTAGTVEISLIDNINLLNDEGKDIINPGDLRDATVTIQNEGNKSVDTRTTITLTGMKADGTEINFTGDSVTQSEYDLYLRDDVEYIDGEGWKPKDGAQPLQVKEINGNEITYELPIVSLNGNSDKHDEYETIDGVDEYAHTYDIVFIMKSGAGNEWQDTKVSIEAEVEAKQHENTGDDWTIVDKTVESTTDASLLPPGITIGEAQFNNYEVVAFVEAPDEYPGKVWNNEIWGTSEDSIYINNGVAYELRTLYIYTENGSLQANEDMSRMFTAGGKGWDKLKFVDFGDLDMTTAKDVSKMFYNCTNLRAIKADNWTDTVDAIDTDMFTGCTSLVGAIAYNANKTGLEMANPTTGYFVSEFSDDIFADIEVACEHNYEIAENNPDLKGYAYEAFPYSIEPTCDTSGYTCYKCSICGDCRYTMINSLGGHDYVGTTIEATDKNGAYIHYECTRCDSEYNEGTCVSGHSFEEEIVGATEGSGSYTIYTCTVCLYSCSTEPTCLGGHSYEISVQAPEINSPGLAVFTCGECGYSYQESITPLCINAYNAEEHAHVTIEGNDGKTYHYCALIDSEYDDADGVSGYVDGDEVFYPIVSDDAAEAGVNVCPGTEGHNHQEIKRGAYTVIYCEGIVEAYQEDNFIYMPWSKHQ